MLLTLMGFIIGSVFAEDFNFYNVAAVGTGCPSGSTTFIRTPDGKAVSILFSEMMAEVPQFDGNNDNDDTSDSNHNPMSRYNKNMSYKVCKIIIEGKIPQGEKVESIEISVDFRGNTFMDPGTLGLFNSRLISWNGPNRVSRRALDIIARKVWRFGDVDEDWVISNSKTIFINSNCSSNSDNNIKFALNNSIKAMIRSGHENEDVATLLTLDSADLAGKLKLKVNTRKCGRANGNARPDKPRRRVNRDKLGRKCPRSYQFDRNLNRCVKKRDRSRSTREIRRTRVKRNLI